MHHVSTMTYDVMKYDIMTYDIMNPILSPISYKINQGVMVGGSQPLVEDNLWCKITFGVRQPSVENDLQWKTTFGVR